ncbi:MAG: MFS transporter [Bacteroidetes bacterium]|nr:MFS transporter [Bacteroidota bacterium]
MRKTPLAIIFLITFIDLLGFGIVIPIIPSYAEAGFGASDIMVGLLVASFSFMQLLFTPLWGRLSDRLGRRPILLFGLLLTVIGYILFGMAQSLAMLFLARMLAGIGGANISAAQAYISDVTRPEERARGMGLIGAAFGLGFVFGPFIGGALVGYGYSIPGYAAAIFSAIALLTAFFALPESLHSRKKAAESADDEKPEEGEAVSAGIPESSGITASVGDFRIGLLIQALRRPFVGPLLLLFFLITFGYANIYATFPMISTREFGFTEREVGYLFGFIGIISAITQGGLIRWLSRFIEERRLFVAGALLTSIGLTAIPFAPGTWSLLVVLAVLSVGTGVMTPSCLSLISRHADEKEQGGVLGINQSLGSLGRVLGPVWGAFVFQALGTSWPFLTGGFVLFLVVILAWRTLWGKK